MTEEDHYILDCRFGPIREPERLAEDLKRIPGLLEHGLFIGLAHLAIIGKGDHTEIKERPSL